MALRGLVGTAMFIAALGLLPFLGWLNWYVLLLCVVGLARTSNLAREERRGIWGRILWILLAVSGVRLLLGGGFF